MRKTDVIGHHIVAAIQMIAIQSSPVSTHVIVMAAEEMIRQVAAARNVPITADYRIFIKDEFQSEYLNRVRKAYNWFKHADRDANAAYDGPPLKDLPKVNDILTLINIMGHAEIGGIAAPIFSDYATFLSLKYPEYMKPSFLSEYPALKAQRDSLSRDPEVMSVVLQGLLSSRGLLPKQSS